MDKEARDKKIEAATSASAAEALRLYEQHLEDSEEMALFGAAVLRLASEKPEALAANINKFVKRLFLVGYKAGFTQALKDTALVTKILRELELEELAGSVH